MDNFFAAFMSVGVKFRSYKWYCFHLKHKDERVFIFWVVYFAKENEEIFEVIERREKWEKLFRNLCFLPLYLFISHLLSILFKSTIFFFLLIFSWFFICYFCNYCYWFDFELVLFGVRILVLLLLILMLSKLMRSLPGRTLAQGQPIWIWDAQFADSKSFTRSLLAKVSWYILAVIGLKSKI